MTGVAYEDASIDELSVGFAIELGSFSPEISLRESEGILLVYPWTPPPPP